MDRNSKKYKVRRKLQYCATGLFGYKTMSNIFFYIQLKKKCNLKNPKSFNEKLCWLKLYRYAKDKMVIQCADKYEVRNYVKKYIGEEFLTELFGVWDCAEDIDFDRLPKKFILKCNHGCAYNYLVDQKDKLDIAEVKNKMSVWLREDFSLYNAEPHYHYINRKIICEENLGENLVDYKFFCFNGKVVFYYISENLLNDDTAVMCQYMRDGTKAPFQRPRYAQGSFDIVDEVEDMIVLAEKLAQPFPFVRVDFIYTEGKIYFSELTFTPSSGYNLFEPQDWDEKLGKLLTWKN